MINKRIAKHLIEHANGYGMANSEEGKQDFYKCISSIPHEHLEYFIYTLCRIAEKSGAEGFAV